MGYMGYLANLTAGNFELLGQTTINAKTTVFLRPARFQLRLERP